MTNTLKIVLIAAALGMSALTVGCSAGAAPLSPPTTTPCDPNAGDCGEGETGCGDLSRCNDALACVDGVEARFGLPSGSTICLPLHCTNKALDREDGEEDIDCGGPCGPCDEDNPAPVVSDVHIVKVQTTDGSPRLACRYSFEDADGDLDHSIIEWQINSVLSARGEFLTTFEPGDDVLCRVTAFDGETSGNLMASDIMTIPAREPVTEVVVGDGNTCAIRGGGLYCWGASTYVPLLGEALLESDLPAPVATLEQNVSAVALGLVHLCAVQDGALKCWGDNSDGQLGMVDVKAQLSPAPVQGMSQGVSAVAVGLYHTCAVQDGGLKCWGDNRHGQLGDGTRESRQFPTQVPGLERGVTAVVTYDYHTCALQDGGLKCWGDNSVGQLGDALDEDHLNPTTVLGMEAHVSAVATSGHTCAIKFGELKCWGRNTSGALGDGTHTSSVAPREPVGLAKMISAVSVSSFDSCAVAFGQVKCWGYRFKDTPTELPTPGLLVNKLALGRRHSCLIAGGELQCWGSNNLGELGLGRDVRSAVEPKPVNFPW